MIGAKIAQDKYIDDNLKYNECYQYAVVRNILYENRKNIEILVNYEPKLHYFTEWWKQLYGESEGKQLRGIFPTGVDFTTDLHSMGQYIQEGRRNLFETVLSISTPQSDITIKSDEDNLDGLNFVAGKTVNFVNKKDALEWEREFLRQTNVDFDMKFESFVEIYISDIKQRVRESTFMTKENIIRKKIVPFFKNKKMNAITAKDVIQWQNGLMVYRDEKGKGYSPVYLKTIYDFC